MSKDSQVVKQIKETDISKYPNSKQMAEVIVKNFCHILDIDGGKSTK